MIQPNLLFTINYLLHFTANLEKAHCNAIKYAIAYIKKIIDYRITYYYKVSLQSVSFVNFDYANSKDTQRPTDGYIFFVGEEPVLWSTKR